MNTPPWMMKALDNDAPVWWGEAADEPAREDARPTRAIGALHQFVIFGVVSLMTCKAFGLGSDYPNDRPVGGSSAWPEGLKELVNTTNRVHGFFVNADDVFFFSGNSTNFSAFLRAYSKIENIETHRLILHEGTGLAKSPWSRNGKPCDWKLYGSPAQWHNSHSEQKVSGYVLEVHFWTGGKIALDQVAVPRNMEFEGDRFNVFRTIRPGMTRAEVEKRFKLDGGLQGPSPVRFLHSSCANFKVNVEFDFKRDAAEQNRAVIGPDDKVIRVSKPYLQPPFMD